MTVRNRRISPQRHQVRHDPQLRPGVVVAAALLVAASIGTGATSILRGHDPQPTSSFEQATRSAPAAVPAARSEDPAPLPLRSPSPTRAALQSDDVRTQARTGPVSANRWPERTSSAPAAPAPEWNGKEIPTRDWMRWQLRELLTQVHPHGGVSAGALEAGVDDALELYTANHQLARVGDPRDMEAAEDRRVRASERLASNLGVEGLDIPSFE